MTISYDRVIHYQQKVDVVSTAKEATSIDRWEVRQVTPQRRPQWRPTFSLPFVFAPAVVAETVTLDKWHAPHQAAPRARPPVAAWISSAIDPTALTAPEAVSVDRWEFRAPAAARRPPLRPASIAFVVAPAAAEIVTPDKWLAEIAQPAKTRRRAVETAPVIDPVALTRPESVSIDRWEFRPLMARGLRPTRQTEPTFVFAPAAGAEVITADKWLSALAQSPRRPRPAAQAASVIDPVALTRAEAVSIDRWLFSSPAPARRRLAPQISVTVVLAPVPGMTWLDRMAPPAPAAPRRAQVPSSPFVPIVSAESILLDRWHVPSNPVIRRTLATRHLAPLLDPFPSVVPTSIDRWFFDSLPPQRRRARYESGASVIPFVVPPVVVTKGFHTVSDAAAAGPGVSDQVRAGAAASDAVIGGAGVSDAVRSGASVSSGGAYDWRVSDS